MSADEPPGGTSRRLGEAEPEGNWAGCGFTVPYTELGAEPEPAAEAG